MDEKSLQAELLEAETALQSAISNSGPESLEVSECLQRCAGLLRRSRTRLLDAANMEARARVIRSKQSAELPEDSVRQGDVIAPEVSDLLRRQHDVEAAMVERTRCPFCAEWIAREAILCRFCKSNVKPEAGASRRVQTAPVAEHQIGFSRAELDAYRSTSSRYLVSIAKQYERQGQVKEARQLFEMAVAQVRRSKLDLVQGPVTVLSEAGRFLHKQGDLAAAEELLKLAHDFVCRQSDSLLVAAGQGSARTRMLLYYARLLRDSGRQAEADSLDSQAKAIQKQELRILWLCVGLSTALLLLSVNNPGFLSSSTGGDASFQRYSENQYRERRSDARDALSRGDSRAAEQDAASALEHARATHHPATIREAEENYSRIREYRGY